MWGYPSLGTESCTSQGGSPSCAGAADVPLGEAGIKQPPERGD